MLSLSIGHAICHFVHSTQLFRHWALLFSLLLLMQVPKEMSEEDIFPTFDSFGPLKDVAIIRDKHTGLHRGCAFVTYWASADAERAQESLHDKITFPGARRPAQVKPAEPSGMTSLCFVSFVSRLQEYHSHWFRTPHLS